MISLIFFFFFFFDLSEDEQRRELCKVKFSENDLRLLRDAIEDLYYFEFVIGK